MKIYTVTSDFYSAVVGLFRKHSVEVLPKDSKSIIADLIIFTGGEDVHPKFYGGRINGDWYNEKRDEYEFEILNKIRKGQIRTTKVLGICRGIQLLNVGFGGTLHYDIPEIFGKSHPAVHAVTWQTEGFLPEIFPRVNSLHHQGLDYIGDAYSRVILGYEPETKIPEAVLWGEQFLGVQFHPELWRNQEERDVFAEKICDWIAGRISISSNSKRKPVKTPVWSFVNTSSTYNPEEE